MNKPYRKYGSPEGKTKVCNRCNIESPITNYYDHPRSPIKGTICRDCISRAYKSKRNVSKQSVSLQPSLLESVPKSK